jgi:maleamate amidohydrolase
MEAYDVSIKHMFGRRLGFGASPALFIIDFQNGFKDPALFGTKEVIQAIALTEGLLKAARDADIPVVYSRHMFAKGGSDLGIFGRKSPHQASLTEDHPFSHIVEELSPHPEDIIVRKRHPSPFFASDLAGLLRLRGIDTAIITGCSTSGCVHATVVDAMSHGFRPMVVRECVGDRHDLSHEIALLNIDMKYGDVVELDEVMRYLKARVQKVAEWQI